MDPSTPFQPWTSDDTVNVKDERPSSSESKSYQYDKKLLPSTSGAGQSQGPRLASDHGAGDDSSPYGTGEETRDPSEVHGELRMDPERIDRMQQIVENTLSPESKQRIMQLLDQVDLLNGAEKLLLYLKLPAGPPAPDPLKQPLNPLGSRSEIQQTVMWIQTHLEVDPEVSLPKQDVYDEYIAYCMSTQMKPLSTADFGKVMKQVYPGVRPRRLGTRGNSRYCYAGMRKKVKLEEPQLPDLGEKPKTIEIPFVQNELLMAASQLIREWAEKLLNIKFINLCDLAQYLVSKNLVEPSAAMALTLLNVQPEEVPNRSLPEEIEIGSSSPSKPPRSGVIKQLKRKIQAQPQPVTTKFYGKRNKLPSTSDQSQAESPQPGSSCQPHSPHIKTEVAPSPPEHSLPHSLAIRGQKPMHPVHKLPDAGHPPYSYERAHAVNLSQQQQFDSRSYYPPEQYKPLYHESYKYNPYYVQDMSVPHNLSMSNYINPMTSPTLYPPEKYTPSSPQHHMASGCLPINLSCSGSQDCPTMEDYYKSNIEREQPEMSNPQDTSYSLQSETLNLTVGSKSGNWPNIVPPPRPKLPLPGKKMILEAYNNENQLHINQTMGQEHGNKLISPGKDMSAFNSDEYRPKKMRASESFGGKLAARIPSLTPSQSFDPHYRQMEAKGSPSNIEPKLRLPSPIHETGFSTIGETGKSVIGVSGEEDRITTEEHDTNRDFIVNTMAHSHPAIIIRPSRPYLRGGRGGRMSANYPKPENVEVTNEAKPAKPGRGRPRKKSLTKAKYTRRQPRIQKQACNHLLQPKRSSDSCCSLSEDTIKPICKEKHSEILNRERVISICNLDKHALDDYLNEGNSQEHDEELMKYFQNNTESQPNESSSKEPNLESKDTVSKSLEKQLSDEISVELAKNISSLETEIKTGDTQTLPGNFLDSNLDLHDEHSQGKSEKISQLRELLEKNLLHGQAGISPPPPASAGLDINAETVEASLENINTSLPLPGNGESAFKSINGRNITISCNNFSQNMDLKEGSASASLTLLSQRQQNKNNDKPNLMSASSLVSRGLNTRRRVSFETPIMDPNVSNLNLTNLNKGRQSVPQSPTSRTQHFNFMPISPRPHSPISSKDLNIGSIKQLSPNKTYPCHMVSKYSGATSPVVCSTNASPFVSPRNTPVPRAARNSCQLKPVPNRGKRGRMCGSKALRLGEETSFIQHLENSYNRHCDNFAVPNEQNCIQRFHGCKVRNFPMSAPLSPNILMPRYKPYYLSHNNNIMQTSPADNCNMLQNSNLFGNVSNMHPLDSPCNDQTQPSSADPLSSEVSQFFSDCLQSAHCDPGGSFRSQSAPLNKDGNLVMYDQQCGNSNAAMGFLSYQNTPCNSIPPTPIPAEFCDFGNLNETCESISKAGLNSESLDKIYNILDSNAQETLQGSMDVESDALKGVMENQLMRNGDLRLSNFSQGLSNGPNTLDSVMSPNVTLDTILPHNIEMVDKMENYSPAMDSMFQNQSRNNSELMKRAQRIEFHLDISDERRNFASRSVPSTPLPYRKAAMPNLSIDKYQNDNAFHNIDNEYNRGYGKNIMSKSVPSTPIIPDDRSVFSYSNRDFLINGNSVEVNVSSSYVDSITPTSDSLKQDFLNETDSLMSNGKGNASMLGDMEQSPLQGIVNTELVSFNDDCIGIAQDLQTFNDQGISNDNDLLEDLDKIDSVAYNSL